MNKQQMTAAVLGATVALAATAAPTQPATAVVIATTGAAVVHAVKEKDEK